MPIGFDRELTPFEENLREHNPEAFQEYMNESIGDEIAIRTKEIAEGDRGLDDPHGVIGKGFDLLTRGNFASAKFFDVLINEEGPVFTEDGEAVNKVWGAIKGFAQELTDPEERLLYKDVIQRASPIWAANHPKSAATLGFMLDVVVDPINLFSFGAGSALKPGVKMLTKGGKLQPISKKGILFFDEVASKIEKTEDLAGPELRRRVEQVFQEILNPSDIGKMKGNIGNVVKRTKATENAFKSRAFNTARREGFEDWGMVKIGQEDLSKVRGKIDELIDGDDVFEVTPMSNRPAVANDLKTIGSNKGRGIGVLIPRKHLKSFQRADKVGRGKTLANADINPNDLRFIFDDTDEVFNLRGAVQHIQKRKDLARKKAIQTQRAQRIGQLKLREEGLQITDLLDPGGLKIAGYPLKTLKNILPTEKFKRMANTMGLTKVMGVVESLPGIHELKKIGTRAGEVLGLHRKLEKHKPEWLRFRRNLEAKKLQTLKKMEGVFKDVFEVSEFVTKGDIDKTVTGREATQFAGSRKRVITTEEREEIREFFATVQRKQEEAAKEFGIKSSTISDEFSRRLLHKELNNSNLSQAQKSVVAKMQDAMDDLYALELEAGVAKDYFRNYNPTRYENINTVSRYIATRQRDKGELLEKADTFLRSKRFKTDEQAKAAGFQPIMDAGRLYLMRYSEHRSALRKASWKKWLKDTYGTDDLSSGRIPQMIVDDLERLGEVHHAPLFGETGKMMAGMVDSINHLFRKSATVVRFPTFTAKQAIGNFTQTFAEMGIKALNAFSWDSLEISGALMFNNGKLPKGTKIRDAFGIEYTAEDLYKIFQEQPVWKNTALERVAGFATESQHIKNLTSDLYAAKGSKDFYKEDWALGMKDLFLKGNNVLQWPAKLEDFYRTSTFIQALRMGNSPANAMELVDNALFNYTSGLHRYEQMLRRTAIPFFTFQKFGIELLGRTLKTAPARVTAPAKAFRGFFDVWQKHSQGKSLTPEERSVIPGYLLAQPHTLQKFEEIDGVDTAVFRTFNNMAFFDVLNFAQADEKGNFDIKETILKGALAQLAPLMKAPLELFVFERELFTERPLEGVYAGGIGNVDYDRFMENMATQLGMHGGAVGAAGGRALAGLMNRFGTAEKVMKALMDWEEGVDPQTGERRVYINPTMLYLSKSILPSLNMSLRASRDDMTTLDNVLYYGLGIGTSKVDLKEAGMWKAQEANYEYHQKLRDIKKYMEQGRKTAADEAREDLLKLLEYNQQEFKKWLDPSIRGRGY